MLNTTVSYTHILVKRGVIHVLHHITRHPLEMILHLQFDYPIRGLQNIQQQYKHMPSPLASDVRQIQMNCEIFYKMPVAHLVYEQPSLNNKWLM